jgi:Na+/proline symporter
MMTWKSKFAMAVWVGILLTVLVVAADALVESTYDYIILATALIIMLFVAFAGLKITVTTDENTDD